MNHCDVPVWLTPDYNDCNGLWQSNRAIVNGNKVTLNEDNGMFSHSRYNNMAHPDWGSVDNRLSRRTPPSYR